MGRVLAFIQARTTSTRLPNKIYKDLNGAPLLYHVIARAKEAKLLDDVIVVSPAKLPDIPDGTREFIYNNGNENDVLSRFARCLDANPCDYVVRLTADCPMLDPHLIDYVVRHGIGADYCSNVLRPTFPDGVDTEMISINTLKFLDLGFREPHYREHVTLAIREIAALHTIFRLVSVESNTDYSAMKISVDTDADMERVRALERIATR